MSSNMAHEISGERKFLFLIKKSIGEINACGIKWNETSGFVKETLHYITVYVYFECITRDSYTGQILSFLGLR